MIKLEDDSGRLLVTFDEIERETLKFYGDLVGKAAELRTWSDIVALRGGKQVSTEDRKALITPITQDEIVEALHQLGDRKAPDIDEYGENSLSTHGV